jgi:hypothetical protein
MASLTVEIHGKNLLVCERMVNRHSFVGCLQMVSGCLDACCYACHSFGDIDVFRPLIRCPLYHGEGLVSMMDYRPVWRQESYLVLLDRGCAKTAALFSAGERSKVIVLERVVCYV